MFSPRDQAIDHKSLSVKGKLTKIFKTNENLHENKTKAENELMKPEYNTALSTNENIVETFPRNMTSSGESIKKQVARVSTLKSQTDHFNLTQAEANLEQEIAMYLNEPNTDRQLISNAKMINLNTKDMFQPLEFKRDSRLSSNKIQSDITEKCS